MGGNAFHGDRKPLYQVGLGLARRYSKLHINGLRSEAILLGRGVRQGYPLSPLLFAISTQPLMSFMDLELENGRLTELS